VSEPSTPDCLTLVIEREERVAMFRRALTRMSPLEQQVLLRRVCGGQPFATVAHGVGLPLSGVRDLFASAVLRLAGGHGESGCDGRSPKPTDPENASTEPPDSRPQEPRSPQAQTPGAVRQAA
jgi:hypothetical protein